MASCQSELSVSRLSRSSPTFAALRMYLVMMEISCSSVRRKSFLNSDIVAGERDVRWVSTPTTDWMSSWRSSRLPLTVERKDSIAHRTAFSSLKVM